MLLSLFEWLSQCIAGLLDIIIDAFLGCLDLNLSVYLTAFPALADVYDLLQIVGLGLTLLVGVIGLFNFLFLKSAEMKYTERPELVLVRTAVAAGMVYYGGYILEYVVQLASWSFAMFNAIEAKPSGRLSTIFSVESLGQAIEQIVLTGTVSELAIVTTLLLLVFLVAYNLLKLLLEVTERYMMVGVLVFTSPIAYCTIASGSTMQIFKRWMSMVVSACIMMSMSVLFLKLIINGLFSISVGENYFMQLLLVLAMCKIAQRVDSYMKSLGLTVAETGGGLLSDIGGLISTARTAGALAGVALNGGKGSRNSVLGSAGDSTGSVRAGGFGAAAINGMRQTRSAFVNGATVSDSVKAGAKAAGETLKRTPYGGAAAGAAQAKREGTDIAKGAARGAAEGLREGMAQYAHPADMNARNAVKAEAQSAAEEARKAAGIKLDADNSAAASQAEAFRARSAGETVPQEIKDRIHGKNSRPFTASEADANFAAYGIAEGGQSALTPSGSRPMDEYKADAVSQLKKENAGFAADYADYRGSAEGQYAPGTEHYMSEGDFENKWGKDIAGRTAALAAADMTGDGFGMELSDNALASGLTLQSAGGDQTYVQGREDQVGAFLANEYTRAEPVAPMQGIKGNEEYQSMAIQSLAEGSPAEGFDRDQFVSDMGSLDKDDFMTKYGDQIESRAADLRSKDIAANSAANDSYRGTVEKTAEYASPNASVHAFFDNAGTLEGNDQLGNAMMDRAFSVISADKAPGTGFTDVRAYDRPSTVNEVTGKEMSGGRVVEAQYLDRKGTSKTVRIYDEVAHTSMTETERESLRPYKLSTDDNRTFWTNADIGGASSYAEKRVRATSGRRVSGNGNQRPQTGSGTGRTIPPKAKKSQGNKT